MVDYKPILDEKVTKHKQYSLIIGGTCSDCFRPFREGYAQTIITLMGRKVIGVEMRIVDKRCKEAAEAML